MGVYLNSSKNRLARESERMSRRALVMWISFFTRKIKAQIVSFWS